MELRDERSLRAVVRSSFFFKIFGSSGCAGSREFFRCKWSIYHFFGLKLRFGALFL